MNPNYPPDMQSPDDAGMTTCACGRTIAIDTADERDGRLVCRGCRARPVTTCEHFVTEIAAECKTFPPVRSEALLACPFCGRSVQMRFAALAYEIRCYPCDLIFPVHGSMDKAKLAKAWNTRARPRRHTPSGNETETKAKRNGNDTEGE